MRPPERTTCVIVGGGPAGLVLGLLLARGGVAVTVLEKHADFLRDFRGDTVHPTTLGLLEDLGLVERLDAIPHSRITQVVVPDRDGTGVVMADFGRLPVRHPYVAMVPQWDLLELLADAASREPGFTLLTEHEVVGVVREEGRVVGVDYRSPEEEEGRLLADLTVACDGRWSVVRRAVGLTARSIPVGFDVWWYRVPTRRRAGESLLPRLGAGTAAIAIPREGYVQVARLGPKGTDAALRARGVEAFRAEAAALLPELAEDLDAVTSMDEVKHLDVRVDRLERWHRPGVLCLGDAAHAMSPVGGVGINLAVQDAVAAGRLLAGPLRRGVLAEPEGERLLARVQRRRALPATLVQTAQRAMHARLIMPALAGTLAGPPAGIVALMRRLPVLTLIPALVIGIGPRPERAPVWARR
ncbi:MULTISPECIES: FAD-dependent oxidoreductase [unclassified Rathayibacter]|uniref:FAD-dependent oxidoreductase n=1 Tax=unclassified Rathayibacter TaxID=2609250 RepID=UPI00188B4BFE|nr:MULTISPECIES: FAD-dependent oxidoreductase [unclassified Rathayibacter]MBF4463428.1 FAD-dependent oxidoreductase [Rathayibacter sp. VKM Ac-2879]MBF4504849.1 FAD-dependent oxidoreductase [Rathayibacter sp. VKM Ac-2878]